MTREEVIELLVNQTIGGQSMLFEIFTKILNVPQDKIQKKELTYFALSVLSYLYLRIANSENREDVLEMVTSIIFQRILPDCDVEIFLETFEEYEYRYNDEYEKFIPRILDKDGVIDSGFCTTLLMQIYEHVTGESAEKNMIKISVASPLLGQYVVDNIDFIKTNFP